MNAPLDAGQRASLEAALASVTLDDKYTLERCRAYMSGIQALVRLPMLQQERDKAAGLNTAGFISGYRGSPLGGLDQSLWKAKQHLAAHQRGGYFAIRGVTACKSARIPEPHLKRRSNTPPADIAKRFTCCGASPPQVMTHRSTP